VPNNKSRCNQLKFGHPLDERSPLIFAQIRWRCCARGDEYPDLNARMPLVPQENRHLLQRTVNLRVRNV
jgi:hypothetical protein